MLNEQEEQKLLEQLLRHDLEHFASVLEMGPKPKPLSDEQAAALLNLAERYSRQTGDEAKNRTLMICGLLWEHRSEHWHAAPAYAINLLSRIGLAPSMSMLDPEYKAEIGMLRPLGSIALESAVTARCIEHEVSIGARTRLLLSQFQHDVWRAIDRATRIGISAPTSAGKSHVLVYKTLDLLLKHPGNALFVVPTVTLIQQVSRDLRRGAERIGMSDLCVLQTYSPDRTPPSKRVAYVLTQERALAALASQSSLENLRILVVDEIQNIERVANESDERSRTLLDVLEEFAIARTPERIVISGPRIENIGQLTRHLFGRRSISLSAELPPVVNITYTFSRSNKSATIKQYCTISETPLEVCIDDSVKIPNSLFGGKLYHDPIHNFVAELVNSVTHDHGTLVFSPTSDQATKTAIALAERLTLSESPRLESLGQYAEETVHPNFGLVQCLPSGIAYHHGKVPQHLRAAVEQAFTDGDVAVIACTTTLMQGVNLPAKTIIARNPNLYVKSRKNGTALTAYEFANLRGRAGRLLKDFVGRAVVLDESAFLTNEIDFDFPSKNVSATYEERFQIHRGNILESLSTSQVPASDDPARDLVAYIRQAVLRHKTNALIRLQRVGIVISDREYNSIERQIKELKVPTEVCKRSPYWDPFDLDKIYRLHLSGSLVSLPHSPFGSPFTERMRAALNQMQELLPHHVKRYLGSVNSEWLYSIAQYAQDWSTERPLREIIGWGPRPDLLSWEEIDQRVRCVTQTVVHDIPKLLRPVVQIQDGENPILGFLETGAFHPITRRFVELGLPRETSVRLAQRVIPQFGGANDVPDSRVLQQRAMEVLPELNYWEQLQIRDTFSFDG